MELGNMTYKQIDQLEENLSNQNRYSIAFNFFVKGKFGKEEYQLELK